MTNHNPGEPTVAPGATGEAVKQLQRARRRTSDIGLVVDSIFSPETENALKNLQKGIVTPDGICGPQTWAKLPDGGPMPTLQEGAHGDVLRDLQRVLKAGAAGQWHVGPQGVDGVYGPHTKASVEACQHWGHVGQDGIVGDATWDVSLHAAGATFETEGGPKYVVSNTNRTVGRIPKPAAPASSSRPSDASPSMTLAQRRV